MNTCTAAGLQLGLDVHYGYPVGTLGLKISATGRSGHWEVSFLAHGNNGFSTNTLSVQFVSSTLNVTSEMN